VVWNFFFGASLLLSAYPMRPISSIESVLNDYGLFFQSLNIAGTVLLRGKPVKDGTVKLTVDWFNQQGLKSSETILQKVTSGEFKTADPIYMDPDDRIRIDGEAWSPEFIGSAANEIFYGRAPVISSTVVYIVLGCLIAVLVILFLWTFTGPQTKGKNRIAIIVSYFVIMIFLAVPLVAPILLTQLFPEFLDQMKRAPVGLIVARPKTAPIQRPNGS
jgi:hypothetical protein